jgi:bidirectional [NiFe] hydrogenase diaphorase subunit
MPSRSHTRTLRIDGRDIGGRENETILELAQQNGIDIPTLCRIEGLSIAGACRLCLVEVAGSNRLMPACATYPEEGMEVTTDSPRLRRYRRLIVELLFSEGNHHCAVCVSNGHCELQDLAARLGMDHVRFRHLNPVRLVDMTHGRFVLDRNRCILCTRCVRVCDEIEGAHTWDVQGRGIEARIVADLAEPWGSSASCTSCGKCVNLCPTGALVEKGRPVGQMTRRPEFLPYLTRMRGGNGHG